MNRINFFLDAGIFAALLIALEPTLTGLPLHEWFSLALAGAIVAHLLLHWKWISTITLTFFKKLFHSSRFKFLVDALLFTAFTAAMLSGLMISRTILPALGLGLGRNAGWREIHSTAADLTLLLFALHFALSWKWLVAMFKRYLISPLGNLSKPERIPAPVHVENDEK